MSEQEAINKLDILIEFFDSYTKWSTETIIEGWCGISSDDWPKI